MALSTHAAPPPQVITADDAPAAAPGGRDWRIATYNIRGGYGAWPRARPTGSRR